MSSDIRSQLRALFERELPTVLDRAAGPDSLVSDRLALEVFAALLRDADLHLALLGGEPEELRRWLDEQMDASDAPPGSVDEESEPGDCVREAATEWVQQYFDSKLAPSSEPGLWRHLDDCPACRLRYRTLRDEEGEGTDAMASRTRRLARGLPWDEVAEVEDDEVEEAEREDNEPKAKAAPGPAPEASKGPETPEEEAAADRRFWLTRKGRWTVYGIAIGLFVLANVFLVLMPKTQAIRLEEESPRAGVVNPLPDQGLSIALLRHQPHTLHDMPWRNVQGAVATGDRLLLTYSLDEGKKKEQGRPRFLTIVAVDDGGRLHWLRPAVKKPGALTSPTVAVPARAVKLPAELRAPSKVERLVIYAVVTDTPVPLTQIQRALVQAFARPDFATTPPLLNLDRSIQFHRVLDVLR